MAIVPLDVQAIIVEWVYRSSQHSSIDYPTLLACAIVCRAWTSLAQRLLFRRAPYASIYYSDPRNNATTTPFLRTLRAAPHLAAHVRFITLYIHPLYIDDNIFEVFKLCTNGSGIYVHISEDHRTEPFLARLATTPMRPIFVSVDGNPKFADSVINMWPSLRALDMFMWSSPAQMSEPPTGRMPHALYSLKTNAENVHCHWSTPTAVAPALRHLDLEDADWDSEVQCAALVASGMLAQLHTLVLGSVGVPPQSMLEALAGLKTLVIGKLPEAACALPQGIWHLGYHYDHYNDLRDEVAHAQLLLDAARGLSKLRLVTVTRKSSKKVLQEFERACRNRGVDFVVYEEPACFPRPGNVDWI
ncbi:hypothetical protein FA95DRAFT_1680462 [Auriscalpium vulgare]|uniref:Uncharacterized protein n=1 Tax=Auriscalpium vulgare TaxID=40419 RepID=A0ACB8RNM3_9AGAM|nr:hypothetical protein FA95DRAFT_1680462 [Auriscalpium vulgare]